MVDVDTRSHLLPNNPACRIKNGLIALPRIHIHGRNHCNMNNDHTLKRTKQILELEVCIGPVVTRCPSQSSSLSCWSRLFHLICSFMRRNAEFILQHCVHSICWMWLRKRADIPVYLDNLQTLWIVHVWASMTAHKARHRSANLIFFVFTAVWSSRASRRDQRKKNRNKHIKGTPYC